MQEKERNYIYISTHIYLFVYLLTWLGRGKRERESHDTQKN